MLNCISISEKISHCANDCQVITKNLLKLHLGMASLEWRHEGSEFLKKGG